MNQKNYVYPFAILSAVHLLGQFLEEPLIHDVTKPFLIPALAYYFYKTCIQTPLNKFVYAALFFSWLGDVLLIFSGQNAMFFITGLIAFLIGHLVYAFMNINFVNDSNAKPVFKWPAVFVGGYGLFFFTYLKDVLGEMMIPVAIYCAVICIMGITAIGRWKRTDKNSFNLVLIGAILFITSDSVIGLNRFMGPVAFAGPIVMSTYLLAQYLLVKGYTAFIEGLKK